MRNDHAKANKHHEYQIYYGGFKIKLVDLIYCKECKSIMHPSQHKTTTKYHVRSHKNQTGGPRVLKTI